MADADGVYGYRLSPGYVVVWSVGALLALPFAVMLTVHAIRGVPHAVLLLFAAWPPSLYFAGQLIQHVTAVRYGRVEVTSLGLSYHPWAVLAPEESIDWEDLQELRLSTGGGSPSGFRLTLRTIRGLKLTLGPWLERPEELAADIAGRAGLQIAKDNLWGATYRRPDDRD